MLLVTIMIDFRTLHSWLLEAHFRLHEVCIFATRILIWRRCIWRLKWCSLWTPLVSCSWSTSFFRQMIMGFMDLGSWETFSGKCRRRQASEPLFNHLGQLGVLEELGVNTEYNFLGELTTADTPGVSVRLRPQSPQLSLSWVASWVGEVSLSMVAPLVCGASEVPFQLFEQFQDIPYLSLI